MLLVEDLPELMDSFKGKSVVRLEFFMPKGLHKLDSKLCSNYWEAYNDEIKKFCGKLESTVKQVHHIQLAPKGLVISDEQLKNMYHPGDIFCFKLVEGLIMQGKRYYHEDLENHKFLYA